MALGPPDPAAGVYGISVAADLVGTGVQNLRAYEKAGLVAPSRTPGGTRLYSSDDIARLRRIAELVAEGLNLNAIAKVLDLQDTNERLRQENARFRSRSSNKEPSASPDGDSGSPSKARTSP